MEQQELSDRIVELIRRLDWQHVRHARQDPEPRPADSPRHISGHSRGLAKVVGYKPW